MQMVSIESGKIVGEPSRNQALKVIEAVYLLEKKWIHLAEIEIPPDIGSLTNYSWFLTTVDGKPAGVIRITYDPSLEFPPELGVTLNEGVDLKQIAQTCKIAEIGRFMILPEFRRNIRVVLSLMRVAAMEVIARKYTHFLADVFENDQTSPLNFLTKMLGFEAIGSHLRGELNCTSNRIILALDIHKGYRLLKDRKEPGLVRLAQKEIEEFYECSIISAGGPEIADWPAPIDLLPVDPPL
jgi:hypothetical protein